MFIRLSKCLSRLIPNFCCNIDISDIVSKEHVLRHYLLILNFLLFDVVDLFILLNFVRMIILLIFIYGASTLIFRFRKENEISIVFIMLVKLSRYEMFQLLSLIHQYF